MKNTALIVIPTYNEKENLGSLVKKIREAKVKADILVADDSSPDGTGRIAGRLAKRDKSLFVLHRKEKAGLGRAYIAGFKWGLERGYRKLISMDADFSHPVEALADLIALCNNRSVAIGSRYVKGGKIVGWNPLRYLNSWGANWVTRALLGICAKDATAGFKCYPAAFLHKINLDKVQASGYAFQVEMLLLAQENGYRLRETPITFVDRTAGESKIHGELVKSAKVVFNLFWAKKTTRQFVKFAIVGAVNTLLDWAVFYPANFLILKSPQGLSVQAVKQIAKAIAFVISATSNYLMNRVWTFRSTNKKVASEVSRFFVVASGGLLINQLVFYLATGPLGWRNIFGLICATAAATLWNFVLNKKWTFRGL